MKTISQDKYRRLRLEWDVVLPPISVSALDFRSSGQIADWGHSFLQSGTIYESTRGEETVNFVLDTGIDEGHEDLKGNVLPQYAKDFTGDGLGDVHGHGTHCAGVISGVDNSVGIIGVAPDSYLVQVKVLNNNGAGSYRGIADAIRYVADLEMEAPYTDKIKQISMSLGGPTGNDDLRNAIKYAINKGVIVYAAAGNAGYTEDENSIGYPGRYPEVITIASIGKQGDPSSFSSAGDQVDITAPGESVLSTVPNGYARMSGTSMATPHVCGVGSLLVSMHTGVFAAGRASNQGLMESFLQEYAKDMHETGFDVRTGFGAPIVTGYLDKSPDKPEDPEEPDTPEPPKEDKPKRLLVLPLQATYQVYWKPKESEEYNKANIKFEVSIKTKHRAEYTYQQVRKAFDWYLGTGTRHLWLLEKADLLDAGYWSSHFAKIIIKKEFDLDFDITKTIIKDLKTNTVQLTGKALRKPPGTYRV